MNETGELSNPVSSQNIPIPSFCPACHIGVRPTDYFCFNCGKNLHPQPLSTSLSSQIFLYLKSLLLPPLGFIWGYRYLKQPDRSSKIVGLMAIALTFIILIILVVTSINLINTVSTQVNERQNQMFQGL